jgi:hypothetical protein
MDSPENFYRKKVALPLAKIVVSEITLDNRRISHGGY